MPGRLILLILAIILVVEKGPVFGVFGGVLDIYGVV